MMTQEEFLEMIKYLLKEAWKLEQQRQEISNSQYSKPFKDEQDVKLAASLNAYYADARKKVQDLLTFPPHHHRHQTQLEDFHNNLVFEKLVMIMTKFPDNAGGPLDVELQRVIATTRDAVTRCQHVPRIASDKHYHPALWDNVELYLLGCSKGIAIVEDKYRSELNPNVALEWGWMKGTGRNVLFLLERTFQHKRADWDGLITDQFDWNNPTQDIPSAVHKWLGCTIQH